MKKLEDIPKKEVFNVPNGYFDKLPGIIQSRVVAPETVNKPTWGFALRYALPVVVLLVAGILWFNRSNKVLDADQMLSAIETEDLIAYLDNSDMTTEELLSNVYLSDDDAYEIEGIVYDLNLENENIDDILTEMEFDNF
ncbi:MAG TPA: hypothetical protein PLJ60_09490 [Chryseolinea sp.]|nr:hypothetical protein [Chryseolinea sp.]HPM30556.1 hypothetical protein [Chryseolinea sp.]